MIEEFALSLTLLCYISVPESCAQARKGFENAKAKYSELMEIIPDGQYYRFHEHWRFVTQRLVFLIALTIYLETGRLATREEVADILGSMILIIILCFYEKVKLLWEY